MSISVSQMNEARLTLQSWTAARFNQISLDSGVFVGAVITGLYLLWVKSRADKRAKKIILPNPISLPVDGVETHRESVFGPDHSVNEWDPGVCTIGDLFKRGYSLNPLGDVFGYREGGKGPYLWISYEAAHNIIVNFQKGLIRIGLKGGQETMVGIFAQNSPKWHMSMQAIVGNGSIAVPLYLTLGEEAMRTIIEETGIDTVICDKGSIRKLTEIAGNLGILKKIISIGGVPTDDEELKILSSNKIQCCGWNELCAMGKESSKLETGSATEEDTAIICYTSGTTGRPKGAMISHKNVLASFKSGWRALWVHQDILTKDDIIMSYLPAAHVFGFICECIPLYRGGRVGYFGGDVKNLLGDIAALRPTIFPAVPRVLNKVYDRVNAGLDTKSFIVKTLFARGLKSKLGEVEQGIIRRDSVWDRVLFRAIQDKLGGRVKVMMLGAAPIKPEVMQWFRAVVGCNIIEGYGQTETTAATSISIYGESHTGHVGVPSPGWQIKLVDVPEMGYYARENKGEICVKGPGVFKGYYKMEKQTSEVLKDGWVYSGDIGTWTPEGRLVLVDRKKNIFKLSLGEYIAPEKIELIYERCPYVLQMFIYGNVLQSTLVGLVIVDEEVLRDDPPECFDEKRWESKVFRTFLLQKLNSFAKGQLASFEKVKNVLVVGEMDQFSVENGLLTPTFKKRRHNIAQQYQQRLEQLYHRVG